MLIYSAKLNTYVRTVIIPKLLLKTDRYEIKGSFKRKVPYVTDIDIVNNIYPEVTQKTIHKEILQHLTKLKAHPSISLIHVTVGTDQRFVFEKGTDSEAQAMDQYLTSEESQLVGSIMQKYPESDALSASGRLTSQGMSKRLFYLKQATKHLVKLRWSEEEIKADLKILRGDVKVKFSDSLLKSKTVLFKYVAPLEGYVVGFDMAVYYADIDAVAEIYQKAADRHIQFASYHNEYYYMLAHVKRYFFDKVPTLIAISNVIEKKFGMYKQFVTQIEVYEQLYAYDKLTYQLAKAIAVGLFRDVPKLRDFKTNALKQLGRIALDSKLDPDQKMDQWHIILSVLKSELQTTVNTRAKPDYYQYVKMIPIADRAKYCIHDELKECLQ